MSKPETRCCRTCALWDIESARPGRKCAQKWACLSGWVSLEEWPPSVPMALTRRTKADYTTAQDGTDCPGWKERKA